LKAPYAVNPRNCPAIAFGRRPGTGLALRASQPPRRLCASFLYIAPISRCARTNRSRRHLGLHDPTSARHLFSCPKRFTRDPQRQENMRVFMNGLIALRFAVLPGKWRESRFCPAPVRGDRDAGMHGAGRNLHLALKHDHLLVRVIKVRWSTSRAKTCTIHDKDFSVRLRPIDRAY